MLHTFRFLKLEDFKGSSGQSLSPRNPVEVSWGNFHHQLAAAPIPHGLPQPVGQVWVARSKCGGDRRGMERGACICIVPLWGPDDMVPLRERKGGSEEG